MKSSVFCLAVVSRVVFIAVQCISNHLIPDHDAGVFVSPLRDEQTIGTRSTYDGIIEAALGGFRRWDAEYFLHIAEYGYTYENTLAFFPLFPLCVRITAQLLILVLPVLTLRTALLLCAVILNVLFFAKAAEALYGLSCYVFRNKTRAKIAAALFCISPASIFFSAPYSESLYCWLTFSFFRDCLKEIAVHQTFPLSLSIVCRSNGLLNVCFLVYLSLKRLIDKFNVNTFLTIVFKSAVITFFVLFHFGLLNAYHFYLFCHHLRIVFPEHIRRYSDENGFVLAGNKTEHVSPWCDNRIPLAYVYVQDHYWNVGFLRYFEYKQIPNFLLATPVVAIITKQFFGYLRRNRQFSLRLGLFVNESICSAVTHYDRMSFVFLAHAFVLAIFCTLCIHVQVTTRMLASSSPILYWVAAQSFLFPKTVRPDDKSELRSTPKIFNVDEESDILDTDYLLNIMLGKQNWRGQLYLFWFLSYSIVGTVMFCNFLPWT